MRVLIFGNSGSGKSYRAKQLAQQHALAHLDLDTIVWEPGKIAVARAVPDVRADLDAFFATTTAWVAEGCYGDLVEASLPHCTKLVFMNPGQQACLENNRIRPWEPHKYASMEAQQSKLALLLDWVAAYYSRDDVCSYAHHRRVFDAFDGEKSEIVTL